MNKKTIERIFEYEDESLWEYLDKVKARSIAERERLLLGIQKEIFAELLFGNPNPTSTYLQRLQELEKRVKETMPAMPDDSKTEQAAPEPQQEQAKPTASTIPTINDTDKEKLVFGNALQKQYMSLNNGCYKWTLTKSLLAYMCGRLYCGDKIKEDATDYSKEYIKGKTQMPAQEVKALFGGVDVASNRYSIKAPPRNSWKVDELFKSNGASR